MTYFLLLPYLIIPLGLAGLLRKTGWESWPVIALSALGLGPMVAAWVAECYFRLFPGPDQTGRLGFVLLLTAVGLILAGHAGLRRISWARMEAIVLWLAFLGAGILYWAWSGDQALLSADTLADRSLASRMFAEGTVDARTLVLTPTLNEVNLVHAVHGLRHLIVIGFTHAFGGVDTAPYDLMPHILYLVLAIALTGAIVGEGAGLRSPLAWLAILAMVCAAGFAGEAMAGQMMSMVAFFGVLVLHLSLRLFGRLNSNQTVLGDLAILVFCLGTLANLHRLGLVFAALPLASLAAYWSIGKRGPNLKHLVVAAAGFLLVFSPFGIDNLVNVGSLSTANPMSPALIAYRASWREAFEPVPIVLAWQQFWATGTGWWLWDGFLVASLFLFIRASLQAKPLDTDIWKLLGLAVALWLILSVLADLTLGLKAIGQELPLRSSRYRIAALPCLAVFAALTLKLLLRSRWRWLTGETTASPTVPYIGVGVLAILMLTLLPTYPRNPKTEYKQLVAESLSRLNLADEERLQRHFAGLPTLKAAANQAPPGGGFLLSDIRPLIRQFNTPMRDPWYFPGAYPLLPCKTPAEAWGAAAGAGITRFLPDPGNYSNPISSATGLRHMVALEATRLVQVGKYQFLFLRDKPLPAAVVAESDYFSSAARLSPEHFVLDVTQPGEYELAATFSSKAPLRVQVFIAGGMEMRTALRSYKPLVPGPQRLRFHVAEMQTAKVELDGGAIPDIDSVLLRKLPIDL